VTTPSTNGKVVSVESLASLKKLPVDYLTDLGLRNTAYGVGIGYFDEAGEEITVRRRTAAKAKDGSSWAPGQKTVAYGQWRIEEARRTGSLFLVEGESDCWALWHYGLPALGLPGSTTAKALQAEHLVGIDTIYVSREPDRGGETFVEGAGARLRDLQFQGRVYELRMPAGIKDPADLHVDDPARFKARLEGVITTSTRIVLAPSPTSAPTTQVASPASATTAPTGYDTILEHFRRAYQPSFRRGMNVYSDSLGREVKANEAIWGPPKALLDLLAGASGVPRDKEGKPKRSALQAFFSAWARSAWLDLLAELPDEEKAEVVSAAAEEQFRDQVSGGLHQLVTLGESVQRRGGEVARQERRSLIDWCCRFARPGPWRSIRSLRIWTRIAPDAGEGPRVEVALRVGLFGQVGYRPLAEMTQTRFARLCESYGVGTAGGRAHGQRVVALSPAFLDSLLEDPNGAPGREESEQATSEGG
jgi:hypothetical protein